MTLRYREIEKAAQRPFVFADALTNVNRKQLIDFVAANCIPAMDESSLEPTVSFQAGSSLLDPRSVSG